MSLRSAAATIRWLVKACLGAYILLMFPQPMATFVPDRPCIVYDERNEQFFRWKPEWAGHYRRYANLKFDESRGIVEWNGDLLAGWYPIEDAAALGFRLGALLDERK